MRAELGQASEFKQNATTPNAVVNDNKMHSLICKPTNAVYCNGHNVKVCTPEENVKATTQLAGTTSRLQY